MAESKKRLVVGVSGASGAPLAVALLRALRETGLESHLIVTRGGELTLRQECGMTLKELSALADVYYDNHNIGDGPASGTFQTVGMVVVPCSMKTVAGIHSGYSDTLLLRAADVTLKERRKLVLVPRECPLSTLHLRNLYELSQMGAAILPPVLSYYQHPKSLDDLNRHLVGKILTQFGVEPSGSYHWEGLDK